MAPSRRRPRTRIPARRSSDTRAGPRSGLRRRSDTCPDRLRALPANGGRTPLGWAARAVSQERASLGANSQRSLRVRRGDPLWYGLLSGELPLHIVGHLAHRRREARHHLGELLVGGGEGGSEQALVARIAVAGRLRGEDHETMIECHV